ncbi:MAG: hypothetical protein M0Q13_13320 [Methanothrix sp.]|jgi:hypothetical protein|nr:hypothetical protein [Methanothrix sp.]
MIPLNEKDVLNFKNSLSKNPDDTELDIWLSWMHYPIYIANIKVINCKKILSELELELSCLESNIFLSLKREDYSSIKAMKIVVKGREEVKDLKRKIELAKYNLKISAIELSKYKGRNSTIHLLAKNRSETSNSQEYVDWRVIQKDGIRSLYDT